MCSGAVFSKCQNSIPPKIMFHLSWWLGNKVHAGLGHAACVGCASYKSCLAFRTTQRIRCRYFVFKDNDLWAMNRQFFPFFLSVHYLMLSKTLDLLSENVSVAP